MKILTLLFLITIQSIVLAQKVEPVPEFMGDWAGSFTDQTGDYDLVARVIGLGEKEYRIQILPEFDKRAPLFLDVVAEEENGRLKFNTDEWSGTIVNGVFNGIRTEQREPREYSLVKILRESPTAGLLPSKDAVILFDGSGFDEWMHPNRSGEEPAYVIIDKAMQIHSGEKRINGKRQKNDLVTKRSFSSIQMHFEFFIPYQPSNRSQGRGNSGLFLQDFYEVQILDSYGSDGLWNDCGALYKMSPPKVNACYPPGQWQTYDITYESPVYNASGKKISNAFITVIHNGVIIHHHTELVHPTANSQAQRKKDFAPAAPAPLKIQDHSNPVKFRNIWVRELNKN